MTEKALQVIANRFNELGVHPDFFKTSRRRNFFHNGWVLVTKDVSVGKCWINVVPSDLSLGDLYRGGLDKI